MNKRQAKKAFKKKYGCTPNQATYILKRLPEIDWGEIAKGVGEAISGCIKAFIEAAHTISETVDEFVKVMHEGKDKT